MRFVVRPAQMTGTVLIPASKSHTIRALFIAALASGSTRIVNPLDSADGRSALAAVKAMGAKVDVTEQAWLVQGFGGKPNPITDTIDVGNSGTTARFVLSTAALCDRPITIVGDASTSSRPMKPLLDALANLGATVSCSEKGTLPATVSGPIHGGETAVVGTTSQFLSSLLAHTPLAEGDSTLALTSLNEKPYVEMTLRWLDDQGIAYEREGFSRFVVKGGQRYQGFDRQIPGDFSSATFFACIGAMTGNEVRLTGLDMEDAQGDKAVFGYLEAMGAEVRHEEGGIVVKGRRLVGAVHDLNATPDALPAMAALAALAEGETRLVNVPQARIKETDRIAVMAAELAKMGVDVEELPDGLIIRGGKTPHGAVVAGHHDHRIVMSLAMLGSRAEGETIIDTAEAVDVTFPNFAELYATCGGHIETID